MNEEQNPKLMALKRVAQDLAKLFGSNLASRKSKKPEEREVWQENKKEEDAFSFFEEEDKSSPKAMFSDLLKKKKEEDASHSLKKLRIHQTRLNRNSRSSARASGT